jgi:hypothetical protein
MEKTLTTREKKEAIKRLIFERAYELMEKAEEYRGILFPKDANWDQISEASLKKALQEWQNNEPVFNKPAFLQ